jgi:hypothetical protein
LPPYANAHASTEANLYAVSTSHEHAIPSAHEPGAWATADADAARNSATSAHVSAWTRSSPDADVDD